MRGRRSPGRAPSLLAALAVVLAGAPAGAQADGVGPPTQADTVGPPTQADAVGPPTAVRAFTATIVTPARVRARPGAGAGAGRGRIDVLNPFFGGRNTLLVLDAATAGGRAYLKVLLPRRPNRRTGWIDATRARVATTRLRVVVSVRRRTVTLLRDGKPIARTRAVVGAPATPTPRGLFAVSARIRLPRRSMLGTRAVALNAFSPRLRTFDGGLPMAAIHPYERLGDPLGTAASHGCIRVAARFVARLAHLPRGTPVLVR